MLPTNSSRIRAFNNANYTNNAFWETFDNQGLFDLLFV